MPGSGRHPATGDPLLRLTGDIFPELAAVLRLRVGLLPFSELFLLIERGDGLDTPPNSRAVIAAIGDLPPRLLPCEGEGCVMGGECEPGSGQYR
mmetsp:Transcript_22453/g.53191  ORF Transcript_22453/g.53191 Transcript_22453/m.53191 type:complete len:94 (-) Transcript_22453:724-1005(-)